MSKDFELPESITSTNPKEAIAFCIAHGIQGEVLPPNFKFGPEGYAILEELVLKMDNKVDDERMTEMMIIFIAGYAVGSGQISGN